MERGGVYIFWDNFRKGEQTGQIATLITLMIAVIFLFVAVTLNIGRVAQKKTVTANAADGAAMKLASYIGSYANKLSIELLDGKDKTPWKRNWGGFWSLLAAIVLFTIGGPLGFIGGLISTGVYVYKVSVVPDKVQHRLQRELNKLKLEDNLTEQAILYAMSNTVDDPAKVEDMHDYDEDGDTTDKIPRFANWYAQRVDALVDGAAGGSSRRTKIAEFLPKIEEFAKEGDRFRAEFTEDATRPLIIDDPERDPDEEVPAGKDGELVTLFKELLDLGITVSFWKPRADTDANTDELDDLSSDLNLFYIWALGKEGGLLNQGFDTIVKMYDFWMSQLYNPADQTDTWYEAWLGQIKAIDRWRPQLYQVIRQLDELIAREPDPGKGPSGPGAGGDESLVYFTSLGNWAPGDTHVKDLRLNVVGERNQGGKDPNCAFRVEYRVWDKTKVRVQSRTSGNHGEIKLNRTDTFQRESANSFLINAVSYHLDMGGTYEITRYDWNPGDHGYGYSWLRLINVSPEYFDVQQLIWEYDEQYDSAYAKIESYSELVEPPGGSRPYYYSLNYLGRKYSPYGDVPWYALVQDSVIVGSEPSQKDYLLSLRERVTEAIRRLDAFQEKLRDFNTEILTFYRQTREDSYIHPRGATYSWHDSLGWHHVRVNVSKFAMPRIKVERKKRWYGYKIRLVLLNHTGNVAVTVTRYDQASAETSFAHRKTTPLWRFRYTKEENPTLNPAEPEQALAYGITSTSTASYTFNALPKIVKAE